MATRHSISITERFSSRVNRSCRTRVNDCSENRVIRLLFGFPDQQPGFLIRQIEVPLQQFEYRLALGHVLVVVGANNFHQQGRRGQADRVIAIIVRFPGSGQGLVQYLA